MAKLEREQWPTSGGGIHSDTSTAGTGTKKDAYSHDTASGGLAGNQKVSKTMVDVVEHLPGSPAGGFPTQDSEFWQGHRWTEAPGKIHDGSGPGNHRW